MARRGILKAAAGPAVLSGNGVTFLHPFSSDSPRQGASDSIRTGAHGRLWMRNSRDCTRLSLRSSCAHNFTMSKRVKEIFAQVQQLSPEEQAELLELLQAVIPQPDPEWEKAWAAECERRWQAYERGEMKSYSWEEVKAHLRQG